MTSLTELPSIPITDPSSICSFVPNNSLPLFLSLWEGCNIPFASMKLENDLSCATGITFTFSGYRYDKLRKERDLKSIFSQAGFEIFFDRMISVNRKVAKSLDLLCLPFEVAGFDVGNENVRQIKTYIRTNISNERFADKFMECDPTSPEKELEVLSIIAEEFAPSRKYHLINILSILQGTKAALEGIAIDIDALGDTDVKMYFLPRLENKKIDPFTIKDTIEFIHKSLSEFNLQEHMKRAEKMVFDLSKLGLNCSFLAVEQKSDSSHELKVDFNTSTTGSTFDNRRVPGSVAISAIKSVFEAADIKLDEAQLENLLKHIGNEGILVDDFTTDFSRSSPSGKVYIRSNLDLGSGVYSSGFNS